LKTVNVSVGNQDLVVDSHLKLKAGVHYAVGASSISLLLFLETFVPNLSSLDGMAKENRVRLSQPKPAAFTVLADILELHLSQFSFELLRIN
jgi:hypothetical protein